MLNHIKLPASLDLHSLLIGKHEELNQELSLGIKHVTITTADETWFLIFVMGLLLGFASPSLL